MCLCVLAERTGVAGRDQLDLCNYRVVCVRVFVVYVCVFVAGRENGGGG